MDNRQMLQNDLHQAMRAKDELRKRVIRLLISSIQLAEVAKGSTLDQSEFISVIQKEIKTKRETIEDALKANRPQMAAEFDQEIKVLEDYLPKQMTEAELTELVKESIQATGAVSAKDMGKVMKVLIPRLQGRATNQDASRVVKHYLDQRN